VTIAGHAGSDASAATRLLENYVGGRWTPAASNAMLEGRQLGHQRRARPHPAFVRLRSRRRRARRAQGTARLAPRQRRHRLLAIAAGTAVTPSALIGGKVRQQRVERLAQAPTNPVVVDDATRGYSVASNRYAQARRLDHIGREVAENR
jgi:hypothetical protein